MTGPSDWAVVLVGMLTTAVRVWATVQYFRYKKPLNLIEASSVKAK